MELQVTTTTVFCHFLGVEVMLSRYVHVQKQILHPPPQQQPTKLQLEEDIVVTYH